jgi:hypothetical protein
MSLGMNVALVTLFDVLVATAPVAFGTNVPSRLPAHQHIRYCPPAAEPLAFQVKVAPLAEVGERRKSTVEFEIIHGSADIGPEGKRGIADNEFPQVSKIIKASLSDKE